MARSMLSSGTDASRAFCTIVRSVALESVSPPPWRAATSTWRSSLANSLPRAASAAPFLCLIVAHLECPLTAPLPSGPPSARSRPSGDPGALGRRSGPRAGRQQLDEPRVDAPVAGQLRVERAGEHGAVAHQHGAA